MSENFLKFKRKSNAARLIKSILSGAGAGLFLSGLTLILSKLCLLNILPLVAIPVGVLGFLAAGGALFILLRKSDLRLAKELDSSFGLHERAQTMIFLGKEEDSFAQMQRSDADNALGKISVKSLKIKRLWVFIVAAALGALVFAAGIIVPNLRNIPEPEEVEPFTLSEIQRIGLLDIIAHVENSKMEEPYRTQTADQLKSLLASLEKVTTKKDMRAVVTESMAFITEITYNSSSMTEIVIALWETDDKYAMALAYSLDTSSWSNPVWGDFIEKFNEFKALYDPVASEGESDEETIKGELAWNLEKSGLAIMTGLANSGISEEDPLYIACEQLVNRKEGTTPPLLMGLSTLAKNADRLSLETMKKKLDDTMNNMSKNFLYAAIEAQKINTNTGEYALTKVSTLFMVPLPGFERPNLQSGGDSSGGDSDDENNDKEDSPSGGGGVGDGAVYGSNDLVLDPLTGEYVEYGTLLERYFPLMEAKLASGEYTEQQKQAIKNYFALLYGGIKKDEGK